LEKSAVFDWEICLIERYLEEPRSKTTHQNLDKRRGCFERVTLFLQGLEELSPPFYA
jgi:hypothetical protein